MGNVVLGELAHHPNGQFDREVLADSIYDAAVSLV